MIENIYSFIQGFISALILYWLVQSMIKDLINLGLKEKKPIVKDKKYLTEKLDKSELWG